jgi:hypothetical protein
MKEMRWMAREMEMRWMVRQRCEGDEMDGQTEM